MLTRSFYGVQDQLCDEEGAIRLAGPRENPAESSLGVLRVLGRLNRPTKSQAVDPIFLVNRFVSKALKQLQCGA
jgi:hypothetical protein